jgi:hypothetical protein
MTQPMHRFLLIAFLALPLSLFAQKKNATLTLSYSFTGVIDGYDYDERMVILADGNEVAEGPVTSLSEPATLTFSLPKGEDNLTFQSWVNYDGNWEQQTIANNYNIDAVWQTSMKLKKRKKYKIALVFDIASGEVYAN